MHLESRYFAVVSCDRWFVAKPLAGGKIDSKDAVEDDQHYSPNYFESIYAVPWNKGEHDKHDISAPRQHLYQVTSAPSRSGSQGDFSRPKDGILQHSPGGIVTSPCNPGTIHQGALKPLVQGGQ